MSFTPTKAQLMQWQQQSEAASQPAAAPFQPTRAQLVAWQEQGAQPTVTGTPSRVTPPPAHHGFWSHIAAAPLAAASGIAEGTRELGQLAATPINLLVHAAGGPAHLIQLPRASFTHALGMPKDAPIEALGEAVPALAGADISAPITGIKAAAEAIPGLTRGIASQAAGGALYGAGQAADQGRGIGTGALIGGATGAAGGAGGEILSALGKPVGRFISREIMDPLTNKAATLLSKDVPAENPLTALGARLSAARTKASQWGPELAEASKAADKGGTFDNSHYKKVLMDTLTDLKDQENEDPDFYTPVVTAVQNKLDFAPSSFKSAVAQRSALNRMPQTWELTNKPVSNMLKGISGKLKDALDEQIERNSADNPAAQDFADKWLEHRRNYQYLKSFDQTPVAMGNASPLLKYSKPQAESVAGELPAEGTLQHFLPRGKDDDTFKMEHLGNLLGNPELARQSLKREYLRPAYDSAGERPNPTKLLTRYHNLSDKQKAYFFSPQEQALLNGALKAKGAARNRALGRVASIYAGPVGLGALAGMGISHHRGEGWETGAILGGLTGAGLAKGASLLSFPGVADVASGLAQKGLGARGLSYPLSATGLSLTQ